MTDHFSKPLLKKRNHQAIKLLRSRPSGVVGGTTTIHDKRTVESAQIRGVIFPWMTTYRIWWTVTALGAIATVFLVPYQMAFHRGPNTSNTAMNILELILTGIFQVDILLNFNLAVYKNESLIFERPMIMNHYIWGGMFWIDLLGAIPLETMVQWTFGISSGQSTIHISTLRLVRFVRLHRTKKLSDMLQYDARISLLWFTLIRNLTVVMALTHMEACFMYFLARWNDFDDSTWLGPLVEGMSGVDRYITSLYWSIVTFCTVGYGDFAPESSTERMWGSGFMLLNVVVAAWIIGSITLLIVKGDEKTGQYRDNLQTLQRYGEMNQFDGQFMEQLKAQLRLDFNNREISDEQVLQHFPSAVRRKVLRKLYLKPLIKTQLMVDIRPQFIDAFLSSCTVEIFSPGEEIVERGSILSDLFLLVGGVAEVSSHEGTDLPLKQPVDIEDNKVKMRIEAGEFIGDIGFFTESPQVESVTCLTLCKTLTLSQANYKLLAQDHPGSAGKILQNLLSKVQTLHVSLPKSVEVLRAGSVFDTQPNEEAPTALYDTFADVETGGSLIAISSGLPCETDVERKQKTLTAVVDLVKMHMEKQLDDQTTRLLFAASRGDTATISLMCGQGFDPSSADYDSRTALMVASMKGNTAVVKLLLEYKVIDSNDCVCVVSAECRSDPIAKADPNSIDMHGSSALLEAVKNGNEETIQLLLENKAELCMPESLAASVLCQAVFDGDIVLLKRLARAGINLDAADYDKRTAAHIAAAEGNVPALKVLAVEGADLTLNDRWGNTAFNEAKEDQTRKVIKSMLEARRF